MCCLFTTLVVLGPRVAGVTLVAGPADSLAGCIQQ